MIPTPTQHHDSKSNLLEAAQAVLKDRQEKASAEREARMHPAVRRRVGVFALLGLAGLLLLILQPDWLGGPKAPPAEQPEVAVASLRLAMLRERQRIVDFAKRSGRLPATLSEVGSDVPGLGYEPDTGQQFKLIAQAGDSLIILYSQDSMSAFLGKSLSTIKNRGRQ